MSHKLRRVTLPSSEETLDDLLKKEASTVSPSTWPTALPLKSLKVAPAVFQRRLLATRPFETKAHTESLARAILEADSPLDPILVILIGTEWFICDGHHRHHAYLMASWKKPVPVRCHHGTVKEAQLDALSLNRKAVLSMTRYELLESAWDFVKAGGRTQPQIAKASGISKRTIWTMCKVLREREGAAAMTWTQANNPSYSADEPFDFDARNAAKAKKLMDQLFRGVSPDVANRPALLASALELRSEKLPRALIYEWFPLAKRLVNIEARMLPDDELGETDF